MRKPYIAVMFAGLATLCMPFAAKSATVTLPATGQTACWDASGNSVSCTGTGQDGEKLRGAAWPTPRFTDNSNGTVTDNLTGLIWLKNANCIDAAGGVTKSAGNLSWANALIWSNNLASGACGLSDGSTAGQWRLPNRKELFSLISLQQANTSTWLNGQGFSNVKSAAYWSSSSYANYASYAWTVRLNDGGFYSDGKSGTYYVWPVQGGESWSSGSLAPDSTITSFPPASSSLAAADFSFTSPDSSATFECKLDNGSWGECTPPMSYPVLANGSHTFSVRAKNTAGNTDSTPASYSWTVTSAPICNAKIGSTCYGTLAAAYTAATNGDTIKTQAITFSESLSTNRGLTITLQGGYDSSFTEPPTNLTTITGLIITSDTVTISGFAM